MRELGLLGETAERRSRSNRSSSGSILRLFGAYALVSLIPVVALGFVLAANYRSVAQARGLAEGRSEAILITRTAIEPLLRGRPLGEPLTATEKSDLRLSVSRSIKEGVILRLRLRNLSGNVVFSDDGSGFGVKPADDVIDAAHGEIQVDLTRLNSDSNDHGKIGAESVEAYVPMLDALGHRLGVLEVYLPYAPINADVTAGLRGLYRDLGIGLGILYLMLFAISASVGRGLRRESSRNAYLAAHDTLTELPNRSVFFSRVQEAVEEWSRHGSTSAVAILDLDRFKEINDTLGHVNGDLLLIELGNRLLAHTKAGDTVARLGGDEFGVIIRDARRIDEVLEGIREVVDREILVRGLPIRIEASIGYATIPEHGTDVNELLQHADIAMYFAKRQRTGVVRYDGTQDQYSAEKLSLVGELAHAIIDGQLRLEYQPKARMSDGKIESVEALVRWRHPERGLIHPDEFIPLAEQTDLIFRLTEWVIDTALSDMKNRLPEDLAVAVNVSARSLARSTFSDACLSSLRRHDVPPSRLIVEVTETALIMDPTRAADVLAGLTAGGIRISLDDFGSGQTSLGYLSELPLYELKIDRSFVADMLVNKAHHSIVRSIVDLGHALSFKVIAEGVESEAVLGSLARAGCDSVQGYFISRPMAVDDLCQWLGNRSPASIPMIQRAPSSVG